MNAEENKGRFLLELISKIRLTSAGWVICRFKMLTYFRVCSAFKSADALPSNVIHNFEISSKLFDFFKSFANGPSGRSHLKNWILVQAQGGATLQPAGILKYVEDLERGPNKEIGPKDFFEMVFG